MAVPVILTRDLSEIQPGERGRYLGAFVSTVQAECEQRYPRRAGYRHVSSTGRPFSERLRLKGYYVTVARGWLWGFQILLMPRDAEFRAIAVYVRQHRVLYERIMMLAGIVAVAVAILMSWSIMTGAQWRATDLIFPWLLLIPVMCVVYAFLWVVTRPLLLLRDTEALDREEAALAEAVREIIQV